jgi:hypothetical protein
MVRSARRRRRLLLVLVLLVVVVAAATISARLAGSSHHASGPPCEASVGTASYPLAVDQAANASTIAAVGKQLDLPDHAVTVALAAALQESELHNLPGGDQDSLGLFQQRPSQGWGTADQIMLPSYAARAFFRHLAFVPGWQAMSVTAAAQAVQRSGAPDAYAQWEPAARLLAQVLTGEVAAGLGCHFPNPGAGTIDSSLPQAMSNELGAPSLGVEVPPPRGWMVATWLVGHAQQFGIKSVAFDGQRWTPAGRTWKADSRQRVEIQIA